MPIVASGDRPRSEKLLTAYWLFKYGTESAASFLTKFDVVVAARGRGATSAADQDLLRALLITAGSALDATAKRLIRDALEKAIGKSEKAREKAQKIVGKDIISSKDGPERVAGALLSESPRASIIEYLVSDLTGDSLQSVEQLHKVAALFGLDELRFADLKDAFQARNQIIHEMDCRLDDLENIGQGERWRRSRARIDMEQYANSLLTAARQLIDAVDTVLSS